PRGSSNLRAGPRSAPSRSRPARRWRRSSWSRSSRSPRAGSPASALPRGAGSPSGHDLHERRLARDVLQREHLAERADRDLELLARLVGVDRLVLGGVVLEDAAQVGQERDEREIADEHRDPDQPLDDDEILPGANRQLIRDQGWPHLEHGDREPDRDEEREDESAARELGI